MQALIFIHLTIRLHINYNSIANMIQLHENEVVAIAILPFQHAQNRCIYCHRVRDSSKYTTQSTDTEQ